MKNEDKMREAFEMECADVKNLEPIMKSAFYEWYQIGAAQERERIIAEIGGDDMNIIMADAIFDTDLDFTMSPMDITVAQAKAAQAAIIEKLRK